MYIRISNKLHKVTLKCQADQIAELVRYFLSGGPPNAIFPPSNLALMEMSRLRSKQSKSSLLYPWIYVMGCFVNFSVIFGYVWEKNSFSKGTKLREKRSIEKLMKFKN